MEGVGEGERGVLEWEWEWEWRGLCKRECVGEKFESTQLTVEEDEGVGWKGDLRRVGE